MIVAVDKFSGFSKIIRTIFLKTKVQLCMKELEQFAQMDHAYPRLVIVMYQFSIFYVDRILLGLSSFI
ncbi:MAG TPA: hypothetical protein PLB48_10630 [Treponema sp.]|nr:hypothetical protein [Treponema sp.]HRS04888.1 hypothetical protein [Treponema sp.]HRU29345.1 hypothetical protein [Treponema sp.]